ncbi:unnamed protein product [Dibothriocephalus latus]|uniref:Uncharacterized protein n=1 Tax=Dibothriocephalus latus TaxID=60516 RepID=A0A3P7LLT9_DIBLA|nr:unnamed protein product [Dibothriocephalus latus]
MPVSYLPETPNGEKLKSKLAVRTAPAIVQRDPDHHFTLPGLLNRHFH